MLNYDSEEEALVVNLCWGYERVLRVGGGDEGVDFGEHWEGIIYRKYSPDAIPKQSEKGTWKPFPAISKLLCGTGK